MKSVAPAGHVGHTVTVTGTILTEAKGEKEATQEKAEKGEKEEAKEYEGLTEQGGALSAALL